MRAVGSRNFDLRASKDGEKLCLCSLTVRIHGGIEVSKFCCRR